MFIGDTRFATSKLTGRLDYIYMEMVNIYIHVYIYMCVYIGKVDYIRLCAARCLQLVLICLLCTECDMC